MTTDAPDPRNDSARRGAARSSSRPPIPIERTERVAAPRGARPRASRAPRSSTVDVPPFDRAAMDGYAVIAEDTFGAGRVRAEDAALRRDGLHRAGRRRERVARGECIEIATGAPMPDGRRRGRDGRGDRKGQTARDVRVFTPVYPRQHVGRRGADIAAGQTVLARRRRAEPEPHRRARRHRALPTSTSSRSRASRSSRPATKSSSPAQPLGPGQIYDINRFTLVVDHRRARRRADRRPDGAPTTCRRADARRSTPRAGGHRSCSRAAARSASAT